MDEFALKIGMLVVGALLITISWRSERAVRSVAKRVRTVALQRRAPGRAVTTYRVARKRGGRDSDE